MITSAPRGQLPPGPLVTSRTMCAEGTTAQKCVLLRQLVEEIELVNHADLAVRWGISREAVRQFFENVGAPIPIYPPPRRPAPRGTMKLYALPEVEQFRSSRMIGRRRAPDA